MKPRVFVAAEAVAAAYQRAPRIARARFRRVVDAAINQDPTGLSDLLDIGAI